MEQRVAARRGPRRRSASAVELAMGLRGPMTSAALDVFSNPSARTGRFTSSLENGSQYPLTRFSLNFWGLVSMYEGSWIARRIVDAPAADVIKTWPKIMCDMEPKELARVDAAVRRTNTKGQSLWGMELGRLFGGAGALIVIKGHENKLDEPLDLDDIPIGSYRGLSVFDRWSGIQPSGDICQDIERPLDVNLPEYYTVSPQGGGSFNVHASRILRFCGPRMPEPENSVYTQWGISVLAPVMQALTSYDNVSANALSLSFRANLIGMKEDTLAQALSGVGMNQKAAAAFQERLAAINQTMSNQSLIVLGKEGELSNIQYSFGGLAELIQMFQLQLAGAAKMPVSLLWGRTYNGLGNAGDGDERIYEKTIATEADVSLRPALEKLLPVVCMSELGEVPQDMDLNFPSIRVLDEKEKTDLARTVVDTVTVALNSGGISKRTYAQELKASSDTTGVFTNITDEFIQSLPDTAEQEGELGEGLFPGNEENEADETSGGAAQLTPSSGPQKVLREEARADKPERAEHAQDRTRAADSALRTDGTICKECGEQVERGACAGCGDYISTHCDASNSAVPCQDCGKWFGNCCCMNKDPKGNRCNKCFQKWQRCHAHDKADKPLEKRIQLVENLLERAATGSRDARELKELLDDLIEQQWKARANDEDGPAVMRLTVHGIPVVIETRKGELRGGKWRMAYDYGYIPGVRGADGDSMDVALGPEPESGWVYLFDQRHLPPGKGFDEHKCFIGWSTMADAVRAFNAGHDRACQVYMDVMPMQVDEFKQWLAEGDHKRPAGGVRK